MLRDSLGRIYQKVVFFQAVLALSIALPVLLFIGSLEALSVLAGAAAVVLGGLVYAALARETKVTAVSAGRVFSRHLMAEGAKILVVLALIVSALGSGWFAAGWLVAAMCVTLIGHGLAVLIIK